MSARISTTVFLLTLLFSSASWADDSPFIQTLQVRGSGRPVELETHAGQTLDRARIERDVQRLWATGWFEDIRVESTDTPEGVQLVFTLVEKPRLYLRRVEFEPANEKRPLDFPKDVRVDEVFTRRVATLLRRQLVQEGYRDAEVRAELIPVGFQEADLLLRVEPGPHYRVEDVQFLGRPGMEPGELRRALRSTRAKRLLPGIPGLWRGWRLLPPFSSQGVEADLERLRSFYLSRGYFDARVTLAAVDFQADKATVAFAVEAGPRYRVRQVEVAGTKPFRRSLQGEPGEELSPHLEGDFPDRALCQCLLEARQESESAGALDFAARLEIAPTEEPPWAKLGRQGWQTLEEDEAGEEEEPGSWVTLAASVDPGPRYTVGRIEFRGHHALSDLTLRRAWLLQEGAWFDRGKLRRSLARLNRMGLFEPVTEGAVEARRDPDGRRLHLTLSLKEAPRGRWSVSGPLGPISLLGPVQFAVGSRLPAWGRGPLELSTYYGTVSVLGFSQPVLRALSLAPRTRWLPLVTLQRGYLPGQAWQSGFLLAPQLGWQGTLASYALTQGRNAALTALAGDPGGARDLTVPVWWRAPDKDRDPAEAKPAGYLLCEARKPRWAWLRTAGAIAMDLLLAGRPL